MKNTKLQKTLIAVVLTGLSAVSNQAFAWGALLNAATSALGAGSSSAADPDAFVKNAQIAETLMKSSLDLLSQSLAAKEDVAKIEALKLQAASKTDAKEKEAIEQEIIKSQSSALSAVDFDKAANEDIAKMDDNQKKKLGAASFNFVLAMLKNKEALAQSASITSSIKSNPMMLTKLPSVLSVAKSLGSQVEMSGSLVTKVPKIFGAVGVAQAPTSTSAQPMEIAD